MEAKTSIFKSPEMEKQFMEVYDQALALWGVSPEPIDVTTSFGLTHINMAGSKEKQPLLLLPGFGANSTMWFPNVAALSRCFRIYAVDTNGQPGKSCPAKTLTAANSNEWLSELMDGLGLAKAYFTGVSLGGWLSFRFAIQRPERVLRAVLLDPAASLEKMSGTFLRHSFIPFMVYPTRAGLIKYFRWMTRGYKTNETWGELMLLGILSSRPQLPVQAVPFTDAQLASVKVPVMVLIGTESIIYNPQRACQRAARLIPGVKAELIPGASHALIAEKADLVNARILEFCQP